MIFNIDKKIMMNAWAVTTRIIQIKILINFGSKISYFTLVCQYEKF